MTLASAARAYSERLAWAVLPLRGKVPAIPKNRGYLDAPTDPATISRWWREYPDANVGVSCIGSNLVVLDVDPRHGGERTLVQLEERHGPACLAELLSPPPPPPVGHPRPVIQESVGGGPCPAYSHPALLSAYENIAGGVSPPGALGTEAAAETLKKCLHRAFVETFPGAPTAGLIDAHLGASWAELKGSAPSQEPRQ